MPPGFVSETLAPTRSSAVSLFSRARAIRSLKASRKSGEAQAPGVADDRHHQRAPAVLALDVDRDAEVDGAVVDAVRLAVDLGEVVGHHRHLLGRGARDRVGDQVGEGDLVAGVLELLAAGVERRDGERAERGGGRDRPRLVHVAGEHRRGALDERGVLGGGGRRRRPCRCPCRRRARRPSDAAAGAAALDVGEVDALGLGDAARDRRDADAVGAGPPSACASGSGALGGRPRGAAPAGGRCAVAGLHAPDDLADRHGVAGLGEDLLHHARRRAPGPRRRPCRWRSRRSSRRPRPVAGLLGPLEDHALGDRLAHRGHRDLDGLRLRAPRLGLGLGAAPPSAAGAPPFVAISASTAPTCDGVALGGVELDHGARRGRRDLGVDLVGRDLDERLVFGDGSPSCLCHSRMVPSETESPIAGMTTSTVVSTAIRVLRIPFRRRGRGGLVRSRTRRSSR